MRDSIQNTSRDSFRKDSYGTTKARVSPVGKAVPFLITSLQPFAFSFHVLRYRFSVEQGYDIDSGWNYCKAKFSAPKMIEISSTIDMEA
ncbi:hypothetical protein K0M31_010791 [Melipona bicolor]|uniref:Uncharacterized protein n=1 Tax=Melipona bicolor TaxID=60889 RepID=A0AA40KI10_9HYME|nr:hypothetical protein K0M31_010791 [Melipona bicolor]